MRVTVTLGARGERREGRPLIDRVERMAARGQQLHGNSREGSNEQKLPKETHAQKRKKYMAATEEGWEKEKRKQGNIPVDALAQHLSEGVLGGNQPGEVENGPHGHEVVEALGDHKAREELCILCGGRERERGGECRCHSRWA